MRKLMEVVWGVVVGFWLGLGVYVIHWYGVWALAWYVGGPALVSFVRRAEWWLRSRSYQRLVDDWDESNARVAA